MQMSDFPTYDHHRDVTEDLAQRAGRWEAIAGMLAQALRSQPGSFMHDLDREYALSRFDLATAERERRSAEIDAAFAASRQDLAA
jgi:hypothetical protein